MSNLFESLKKRAVSKQLSSKSPMCNTSSLRLYSQFAPRDEELAVEPKAHEELCFFGIYNKDTDTVMNLRTGKEYKALHELPLIHGHHIKKDNVNYESVGMYCEKGKNGESVLVFSDCSVTNRLCMKKAEPSDSMIEVANAIRKGAPVSLDALINAELEINANLRESIIRRNKKNDKVTLDEEYYM